MRFVMRHLQVVTTVLGLSLCLTTLAQQPGGQMTPEQRFKQLDRNGDGKLTPQELPGEWFGRLDTNKDGVVTLEEAKAGAGRPPAGPTTAPAIRAVSTPPRAVAADGRPYLVLICIDACRPDYLEFSDIPNIRKLMAEGVTYEQAWVGHLRNDTPPGHAVIATGAFPRTNRIIGFHWRDPKTGNTFKPTSLQSVQAGVVNQVMTASGCGSLSSVYKQAFPDARVVALSSDKSYAAAALGADSADTIVYCRYDPKRGYGTEPGLTLEPLGVTGKLAAPEIMASPALTRKLVNPWDGDTWTVDLALQVFARDKPEILLINLPQTDNSGHKVGATLDRTAMAAVIANADRQIGRIMEAYRQAGLYERTVFVVTADHGMAPNLQTIDEGPMAAIVSKYGMERTAARLEFYVKDPARAGEAAEEIARLRMPGIHRVYYKTRDAQGACAYLPAASSAGHADPELDACYAYLTSTYASAESADVVLFSAEDWNVKLSSEYFKGDHGTVTWDTQHVPLVLAGPGLRRGVTSQAPARLVDIAPTILTAMGLQPTSMEGIALADALASPTEDLTRQQQVVSDRLTPLRDALRRRHDQDLGSQAQPAAQAP
ncbi:MAG: alkaline phosphatase family protein, partial [Armatimonadetes bacterium]|nr:alkaline phosphatase family protein [Armatimonadota bacterium]